MFDNRTGRVAMGRSSRSVLSALAVAWGSLVGAEGACPLGSGARRRSAHERERHVKALRKNDGQECRQGEK